jgi:hypothetical protein
VASTGQRRFSSAASGVPPLPFRSRSRRSGVPPRSGIGSVLTRAVRRYGDVRRFGRGAQLVYARAVAPSWHCERCARSTTGFEHDDAFGRSYLLLEIPDSERLTIARVTRSWSRSFFDTDLSQIPTLYAPSSGVVVCFDPRGEPILGHVVTRPLPRATVTLKWE